MREQTSNISEIDIKHNMSKTSVVLQILQYLEYMYLGY